MYQISVIIPVYNVDKYLDDCIKSLMKQSIGFENLEVIMVDDCSTDNSSMIMKRYEHQCENVKCIYLKENSGSAGKPRNEAIKIASAEYLMFLDSDDLFYENACEILLKTIKEKEVDLVSGYYIVFEETDGYDDNIFVGKDIKEKVYLMPEDLKDITELKNGFWCKIYKKNVIVQNKIEFPENIIGQDSVFFWRYLFKVNTLYYISVPVCKYRQRKKNDKSVSYELIKKHFDDILESMRLIKELFDENGLENEIKFVFKEINEYYINQLIESDFDVGVLGKILNQWEWIFRISRKDETDAYTGIVMSDIDKGDMVEAANKIILLRRLKHYNVELEEAQKWWKKQAAGKDEVIKKLQGSQEWWKSQAAEKDEVIKKLQGSQEWWKNQAGGKDEVIKKLQDSQEWWKNQAGGKDEVIKKLQDSQEWWKEQIEEKDKIIGELQLSMDEVKKWVKEVEQARDWWKNQAENKSRVIAELQGSKG